VNFRTLGLSMIVAGTLLWVARSQIRAEDNTHEKVLFEERFDGKLGQGWSWLYEDKENWRIAGGKLQIRATGGSSFMKDNNGKNYLLRTPPALKNGELIVEAFVENHPTSQYEHAGLNWFYDDDHYVILNKECFGAKAEILFMIEKDAKPITHFGGFPCETDGVWMRFRVSGTHISGEYRSTPADAWRACGDGELPVKGPPTVGVHAGYAPKKEVNRWTSFSHFRFLESTKQ
jgi:hypothetical protein